MNDTERQSNDRTTRDWAFAVVLAEAAALLIALAMTYLPGRNGSTWSPADVMFEDPSQFVRVAASYLFLNLLLLALAGGGWLYLRTTDRGEGSRLR